MSKHKWSAIIYGRSYQIDFRYIVLPKDFGDREKDWASKYILGTLDRANELSGHPRWSLFKSQSHCVVGVTCMVRDLLIGMDRGVIDLLSKDNRGRPLYIFIGYATKLDRRRQLLDFPPYTDCYLQPFQNLYQHILEVWWTEEYEKDSKKPIFSDYEPLDFDNYRSRSHEVFTLARQLNHHAKYPESTYLWENTLQQRERLWTTAAICHQPVSLCVSHRLMRTLKSQKSPFLNQTVVTNASQIIEGCAIAKISSSHQKPKPEIPDTSDNISEAIANKVKEDIEATIGHAKKVSAKSRTLIQRLGNNRDLGSSSRPLFNPAAPRPASDASNFGFKSKSDEPNSDGDWF